MRVANEPGAFLPSSHDLDLAASELRKLIAKCSKAANKTSLQKTAAWLEHIAEAMDEAENPSRGTLGYIQ